MVAFTGLEEGPVCYNKQYEHSPPPSGGFQNVTQTIPDCAPLRNFDVVHNQY